MLDLHNLVTAHVARLDETERVVDTQRRQHSDVACLFPALLSRAGDRTFWNRKMRLSTKLSFKTSKSINILNTLGTDNFDKDLLLQAFKIFKHSALRRLHASETEDESFKLIHNLPMHSGS